MDMQCPGVYVTFTRVQVVSCDATTRACRCQHAESGQRCVGPRRGRRGTRPAAGMAGAGAAAVRAPQRQGSWRQDAQRQRGWCRVDLRRRHDNPGSGEQLLKPCVVGVRAGGGKGNSERGVRTVCGVLTMGKTIGCGQLLKRTSHMRACLLHDEVRSEAWPVVLVP
jgi:hypothetical protein